MSWDERFKLIKRTFSSGALMEAEGPECEAAWNRAFDREPELLGRIVRDILKSGQAVPGRPGPRPALDNARAQPVVDAWMGLDPTVRPYCMLPFGEALRLLAGERSIRSVANLTGIPRMTLHKLLTGQITPTSDMMLKAGRGFKKEPSFFLEWRVGAVASAIVNKLMSAPERSVPSYEALFWAIGGTTSEES